MLWLSPLAIVSQQRPSHSDSDEFPLILWGALCIDGRFLFNGNKGVPMVTQYTSVLTADKLPCIYFFRFEELKREPESPIGIIEAQTAGPTPIVLASVSLGRALITCISNKFSGDVDAAGQDPTLRTTELSCHLTTLF